MALVDPLLRCDRRAAPVFNFVQAAQAAAPNAAPSLHLRRSSGAPPTCRCAPPRRRYSLLLLVCLDTATLRLGWILLLRDPENYFKKDDNGDDGGEERRRRRATPPPRHAAAMAKCGATRLFETVVSCHHVPTQSIPYSLQNYICIVPPLDLM